MAVVPITIVAMAVVGARTLVLLPVTLALRLRRARRSDEEGGGSDSGQTMKMHSHLDLLIEGPGDAYDAATASRRVYDCIFGAAAVLPLVSGFRDMRLTTRGLEIVRGGIVTRNGHIAAEFASLWTFRRAGMLSARRCATQRRPTRIQGGAWSGRSRGDTVRVHYTGTLDDGQQFDSSRGLDPLTFTLGDGSVIQGFDDAVTGMSVGDEKRVTIPAAEAYGPRRDELTLRLPRTDLPTDLELEEGSQLRMEQGEQSIVVTVREMDEESVTLDANHPLAGESLTFDLELVEIVPD